MQASESIRELKNGKRYNTAITWTLSENNSSEGSPPMNSHEINENEGPKIHFNAREI